MADPVVDVAKGEKKEETAADVLAQIRGKAEEAGAEWDGPELGTGETDTTGGAGEAGGTGETDSTGGAAAAGIGAGKTEAAGADPEGTTEEDKQDLPEGLKGKERSAFIRERIRFRKERETWATEREALKKETSGAAGEGNGRNGRNGQAGGELSGDELGRTILLVSQAQRVLAGEPVDGWDEGKAREVVRLGKEVLGGVTEEAALLDVLSKARAGAFGDDSAAVEEMALKELPVVQARGQVAARQRTQQTSDVQQKQQAVDAEFAKAFETWPELKPLAGGKLTPAGEFFKTWLAENMDDMDKAAVFAAPDKRVPRLIKMVRDAWTAREYEATRQERDRLKKQLQAGDLPLGGGGQHTGGGESGGRESDRIAAELFERAGVSRE